jgi:O-antigen ligase
MLSSNHDVKRELPLANRGSNPIASLLNLTVFCGLMVVIPLAVIPYGTVDAWWESVFECSVFALTAMWVLETLFLRRLQVREMSILLPAILLTGYAFLQTVHWPPTWLATSGIQRTLTIDHYQTHLTARKMLALTLFLGLMCAHVSSMKRLRWTIRVVIAVGLGSALFGILRQLIQPADAPAGFVLPFLFYGVGYGEFISPNPFAYLMEMTLGLLSGLVLGGGVRWNRALVYVSAMIVIWTALVLSNSRGGYMAFSCEAVFVIFMALVWFSRRKMTAGYSTRLTSLLGRSNLVRAAVVVLVLSILAIGVVWIGGDELSNKLANESSASSAYTTDGSTRQEIWRASWKLFKANPLTGTGFGTYFLAITQFQVSSGRTKLEQAHNDYLDLADNGGLIAIGLSVWFAAMVFHKARLRLREPGEFRRASLLGAATAILGVAVHSAVDFGLQLTGLAVVFLAIVVVLVVPVPGSDDATLPEGPEGAALRQDRHIKRLK